MELGRRRFTLADQEWFAQLSGDRNPMHLDPLYARRTQSGAPVVHGIHGVLWALELFAGTALDLRYDISVRFESFLYLNLDVQARLRRENGLISIFLESRGRKIATISLLSPDPRIRPNLAAATARPVPAAPIEQDFPEAIGARGAFFLQGELSSYEMAFPNLGGKIGVPRVRAIAGLSTLVGMIVPGLHSIFSKCRIGLVQLTEDSGTLQYEVRRSRAPLRQLSIGFASAGIYGGIDAFVRHPPIRQPSLEELDSAAENLDLSRQRALIVGGSRGLGELTAKLAALAGADVTVTYARGEKEAKALCEHLSARGLRCRARWLDVERLDGASLEAGEFTHLYYFATPPIFTRTRDEYDPDQFAAFAAYYCDAFEALCRRLRGAGELSVFWHSSTALEERPKGMIEYIMAKTAGEELCRELGRPKSGLKIHTLRLPRLATDQTASVTPAQTHDAIDFIRLALDELKDT